MHIPDGSIFTAEAKTVGLALCDNKNKLIFFPDLFLVLKAINHTSSKNQQIQEIKKKCHKLIENKGIVICWIASRIGIPINEKKVDIQATVSFALDYT